MIEGSQEKADMLKQITDIKNHRSHLDTSIDAIGAQLFGSGNGHMILTSLRTKGKPLVDDWGCLKSLVNKLISFVKIQLRFFFFFNKFTIIVDL